MTRNSNRKVNFIDLGVVDFQAAWDFQTELFNQTLAIKTANRTFADDEQTPTENFLIFCEHPHVYTLGKSGKESNLLIEPQRLGSIDASYYRINRGGDITYHGPGQLVAYPLFDLEHFFTDIHKYMRFLEEVVIQTVAEFGIVSGRIKGLTGVWVDPDNIEKARKICAFGVRASRWVTMHGLALNVNTNLDYFGHIIPCGIKDKAVTSIQREVGDSVNMETVREILKDKFVSIFEVSLDLQNELNKMWHKTMLS